MKISDDGEWALARFSSDWSIEECLARRGAGKWIERECDVAVHIEPEMPPAGTR
ncbi:hypothetical protein [Sphingomonas parva]|uniref:hypothetical protein n=1 Tax=Sphingomonas parva TaxID=2555898 RepID=UPI001430CC4D|nr:hypothetical protein [Sphingomonas parva]